MNINVPCWTVIAIHFTNFIYDFLEPEHDVFTPYKTQAYSVIIYHAIRTWRCRFGTKEIQEHGIRTVQSMILHNNCDKLVNYGKEITQCNFKKKIAVMLYTSPQVICQTLLVIAVSVQAVKPMMLLGEMMVQSCEFIKGKNATS